VARRVQRLFFDAYRDVFRGPGIVRLGSTRSAKFGTVPRQTPVATSSRRHSEGPPRGLPVWAFWVYTLLARAAAAGQGQRLRPQTCKRCSAKVASGGGVTGRRKSDLASYRCPNGLSPLGRHGHGLFKHGPQTTRPAPCLDWNPSTRTRHGHGPLQQSAWGQAR
jgi:hypothetical protein